MKAEIAAMVEEKDKHDSKPVDVALKMSEALRQTMNSMYHGEKA